MKRILILAVFLAAVFNVCGQSVGLVLSGGGAKGISHIGVIKALEEHNIPIDYVCGTSMGAVIASFYAIGLSPGEMLDLIKSKDFEAWYNGRQEKESASWFYREDATPAMFTVSLHRKGEKIRVSLPSSLVSPYPMDLAMIEAYASPSVAAGYDFSRLMVPFFCISSDIGNKRKVVHTSGDLGSAVRASMTYPFIFKPIVIDSTVLFDGGFYDNFPWEEMERIHSPQFIVGSQCVAGHTALDDEDIVGQVTNMIVSQTDYDMPQEKGVVIARKYPYGVMEFNKADEIAAMGYEAAIGRIGEVMERVTRRRTGRELDSMRMAFRRSTGKIFFSGDILFEGSLDSAQRSFVHNTISAKEDTPFDFAKLKKGYYRVAATGLLKTFHPSYLPGKDSLLTLKIKGSIAPPLEISAGGNISSSNLNHGYVGVAWNHLGKTPWKLHLHGGLGSLYSSAGLYWRHNAGIRPLMYYDVEVLAHRFKYDFCSALQKEYVAKVGAATPLDEGGSLLLKGGAVAGKSILEWFPYKVYRSSSPKDRSTLLVFSPSVQLEKNTLNYRLYPTGGMRLDVVARWNRVEEEYLPGETSFAEYGRHYKGKAVHSGFRLRLMADSYLRLCRWLRLGINADLVWQKPLELCGYLPALMQKPAFTPFPHASVMLREGYRADTYMGIGVSPVICVAKTLFLHSNISYFQPYRQIYEKQGGEYGYSGKFPRGAFLGNIALVWHSPAGPVSLSASYYQRGEQHQWYPQLNIGLLLFKRKMMED